MPTAEAIVQTGDPGRYLARLRNHAGKMGPHRGHRPPTPKSPPQLRHTQSGRSPSCVDPTRLPA